MSATLDTSHLFVGHQLCPPTAVSRICVLVTVVHGQQARDTSFLILNTSSQFVPSACTVTRFEGEEEETDQKLGPLVELSKVREVLISMEKDKVLLSRHSTGLVLETTDSTTGAVLPIVYLLVLDPCVYRNSGPCVDVNF